MAVNQVQYPRVTIAGTSSGVGKTTIALALMAALSRRGLNVQGFKVGPDFIDPGYYGMVTGRPGRNLDAWMMGTEKSLSSFATSAADADISIIEGVMGLFDGKAESGEGSTASIAKLLKSPVLLTLNCAKMGASAGAMALGYTKYDEEVNIKGFILNNVGSDRHEAMVRNAVESATGLPILGCVRRNDLIKVPERHLGLVTQIETRNGKEYVELLADLAESHIDLEDVLTLAKEVAGQNVVLDFSETNVKGTEPVNRGDVKIGVAFDRAFSFYYHDNFDLLKAYGAELVFFSPLEDKHMPEGVDGLYLGGGYPEVYARELSGNSVIASEIREAVNNGLPVYAECGGLIYLSRIIEDFKGRKYNMSGSLPLSCRMMDRPALGYREVEALDDSIIFTGGDILRGHEFHYSSVYEVGNGLRSAYVMPGGRQEGFIYKNTLATYVHLHFAGQPEAAKRFVDKCRSETRN